MAKFVNVTVRNLVAVAVTSLCAAGVAQNILLEESTGTVRSRRDTGAIEIKLGSEKRTPAALSVTVEEPGKAPLPDQPVNESHIVVKPGEFQTGNRSNPAVVTPQSTRDSMEPALAELPVEAPPTTETVAVKSTSTQEDTVNYLPPANLGKDAFEMRGNQRIPLRPEELKNAPLDGTVPDAYGTTLTNGIHFYHYESRDLPRVRVNLIIDAGSNCDPADKVGLAKLTARTIRSGGAGGKSGDEIDQQLEQIGSELELNVDRDHVSGSLFALTDKVDKAVALLADVFLRPEFDQKKLDQQKDRALEELRRQNDEPQDINRREFRKIIYGAENPLARTETSASVSALTRDDVRAFHDARYRPSTVWIGVSGDISRDEARALVEKYFGEWNRPAADTSTTFTVADDSASTGGVFFTPKATAQSQIRLGHLGIKRNVPEVYAVNILNSIFGSGGFSSRLMNEVRTRHGYVYGVGGSIQSDEPRGVFFAAAASKSKTTGAAIKEILNVIDGLLQGTISERELETARRDVYFTFMNQFDQPEDIVIAHMLYAFRGYPADYLRKFPAGVKAVTAEEVTAAAKKFIHPERLKIYVVGNKDELDLPLNTFGSVTEWPVEDFREE